MNRRLNRRPKKSSRTLPAIILLVIIGSAVTGFFIFFEGNKPTITLHKNSPYVSKDAVTSFSVSDKGRGIRDITVIVRQKGKEVELFKKTFPRQNYAGQAGPAQEKTTISWQPQKQKLSDGEAEIIFRVHDFSMRGLLAGNATEISEHITIDTKPPKIQLVHSERYISQGGAGIVIYKLSQDATKHGVQFNGNFHPGFAIGEDQDGVYVSYIALPFDAKKITESQIYAEDKAGNTATRSFSPVYKSSRQTYDNINIPDKFLDDKIPEFEQHYPEMSGDMVNKYIYTNNTVRQANNKTFFNLCLNSSPERFWKGRFLRMPGASKAGFADHRTYFHKGKAIDKQVHLGMDIASTERVEIKAAERGKVVFARYEGIYGKTVVIDHGQGIFSLYSHLSQIDVAVDDFIEQGIVLGLSGTTGMAGGDHLHFSMLINGIFVNPVEWWDRQWIEANIEEPLVNSKFSL